METVEVNCSNVVISKEIIRVGLYWRNCGLIKMIFQDVDIKGRDSGITSEF